MSDSENGIPFDSTCFERLLGNDAALLSPLFDRAVLAIKTFVDSVDASIESLEFDAHKLKTTAKQIGALRLASVFFLSRAGGSRWR